MENHNFIIGPTDTDSISFCKPDMTMFTKEEIQSLLGEINKLMPEFMIYEDDGYYKKCIVLKAKNYILYDPTKEKESDRKQTKGSAFKSAKKEPIIVLMMQEMVDAILNDKEASLVDIYESYVHKAMTITDIMPWCSKISATESVLAAKGHEAYTKAELKEKGIRANETNVWDAIKHEELVQQGDKYFLFPAVLGFEDIVTTKELKKGPKTTTKREYTYGLLLPDKWNGDNHDVSHLLKRLYCTIEIFENILDLTPFNNYSLVKNYKKLLDKYALV
mgnify:CR=1 FL=1